MMDEDIKRIVEDTDSYDEARGDRLLSILGDFYGREMRPMLIALWGNALVAIAICGVAAMMFFRTDRVKDEIMYAVIFMVGFGWLAGIKLMAWMWFARHNIARDIKRLEVRLADMAEAGRGPSKPQADRT